MPNLFRGCTGTAIVVAGLLAVILGMGMPVRAEVANVSVPVFQWAVPPVVGVTPHGIAVDSSGKVYATDDTTNSIWVSTSLGAYLAQWGSEGSGNGQFNQPSGIAINLTGYLYVIDTGNNRIQVIDPSGRYVTQWGAEGNGNALFNQSTGIAVMRVGMSILRTPAITGSRCLPRQERL